jgi:hypothetical protein
MTSTTHMLPTGHAGVDLLVRGGVVDRAVAVEALELARSTDGYVIECLVAVGADEQRIADCFSQRLLVPQIEPKRLLTADCTDLVPADMALEFFAVPVGREPEGNLLVAMADPTDDHARDEIAFFAGVDVSRATATVSAIRSAIERRYGLELETISVLAPNAAPRPAQTAQPPIDALRAAETSARVAALVAAWFATVGTGAVVLVSRKGKFLAAGAAGADARTLAGMASDLSAPSLIRDVVRGQLPYFGAAEGGNRGGVLLMPILVSRRVIAVVYCDGIIAPLPEPLVRICIHEAAVAYERLLSRRRASR